MLEIPRLETERLLLRLFTYDDAEDMHAILRLEEVVKNINSTVKTLDEVRVSLNEIIEAYGHNTPEQLVRLSLAVVWKETGRVIGTCGLAPMHIDPANIEIYYAFHPDYWNCGVATEAARAVLEFGFRELKLPRIAAITLPDNSASARVIERIGLKYRWIIHDLPEGFSYFERCRYFSLSRDDYLQKSNKQEDSD